MIGEDTEDLGEVWVNLVCRLCLGENISKLLFARDPMELMRSILLSLSYKWKQRSMWRVLRVSLPFLAI